MEIILKILFLIAAKKKFGKESLRTPTLRNACLLSCFIQFSALGLFSSTISLMIHFIHPGCSDDNFNDKLDDAGHRFSHPKKIAANYEIPKKINQRFNHGDPIE
jgi:hypothetical protein